jgi:hypothetical protein
VLVVRRVARPAGQTAAQSLDREFVVDCEIDRQDKAPAPGGEQIIEEASLVLGAGKAVKEDTLIGREVTDTFLDQLLDELVGYQLATLHVPASAAPQ